MRTNRWEAIKYYRLSSGETISYEIPDDERVCIP